MKLSRVLPCLLISLAAFGTPDSNAASFTGKTIFVKLEVHKTSPGSATIVEEDKVHRRSSLGKLVEIELESDEAAEVLLTDPNPLLFAYKTEDVVRTPTANAAAIGQLIKVIETVFKPKSGVRTAGEDDGVKVKIGNLNATRLLWWVKILYGEIAEIPVRIDRSIDGSDFSPVVAEVERVDVATLSRIVTTGLDDLEDVFAAFAMGEEVTVSWEKERRRVNNSADLVNATDNAEVRRIISVTWDLRQERSGLEEKLSVLKAFVSAVRKVHQERPLESVAFSMEHDQTLTVRIRSSSGFQPFLSKKAAAFQKEQSRTIRLKFAPRSRFKVRISPGVVYSFVNNPTYTAVPRDTSFVIQTSREEYQKFSGAVAVGVGLESLSGDAVQPMLQLGVVPDSKKLAFLGGVTFLLLDRTHISAGVIFQKANTLGNDQQPRDVIRTPDELKVEEKFQPGFYIQVGLSK